MLNIGVRRGREWEAEAVLVLSFFFSFFMDGVIARSICPVQRIGEEGSAVLANAVQFQAMSRGLGVLMFLLQ